MEMKRMFATVASWMLLSLGVVVAQGPAEGSKVNENFYIYLCLGQSNMEGNAKIEACDTVNVNPRFKVLQAVDCPDLGRKKESGIRQFLPWPDAVPV